MPVHHDTPMRTVAEKIGTLVLMAFVLHGGPASQQSFAQGMQQSAFWPPRVGAYYPDLTLLNAATGKPLRLSSLRGQTIVVEPIGMSCPACQAFSGAKKLGGFRNFSAQPGLSSFEEYVAQYAGATLGSRNFVFVQLLLYGPDMQAPTLKDAQEWAKHFGLLSKPNCYVLVGSQQLIGSASYNMIPGFQLIDKNFVLRSDATGHNPTNDMWKHFFPALKSLI